PCRRPVRARQSVRSRHIRGGAACARAQRTHASRGDRVRGAVPSIAFPGRPMSVSARAASVGGMSLDIAVDENGVARCRWADSDPEYRRYHDEEWGVPLHGDRTLFEKMSLEGFQAGLSWITILRKRPRFRAVFACFEPEVVARFDDDDVERLMADAGIF